jgi:hypothetical protein
MPRVCGSISAGFLTDAREKYHHSLKALAIREKKIHTVGNPELKVEGTPVYPRILGQGASGARRPRSFSRERTNSLHRGAAHEFAARHTIRGVHTASRVVRRCVRRAANGGCPSRQVHPASGNTERGTNGRHRASARTGARPEASRGFANPLLKRLRSNSPGTGQMVIRGPSTTIRKSDTPAHWPLRWEYARRESSWRRDGRSRAGC